MANALAPASDRTVTRTDNISPREATKERVTELVKAANTWAKDVGTIATPEQAAKMEDLLTQCRHARDDTDAERKAERAPWDEKIREVQATYNPLLDLVDACVVVLKRLKTAWLDKEDARQKTEAAAAAEKARLAQEAADMAAAAAAVGLTPAVEGQVAANAAAAAAVAAQEEAARAAAVKPRVVGAYGGRASGFRTVWEAEITDWAKVAVAYSEHPRVREILQAVANAHAKAMKNGYKVDGAKAVEKRTV